MSRELITKEQFREYTKEAAYFWWENHLKDPLRGENPSGDWYEGQQEIALRFRIEEGCEKGEE